jgi:NADPH:quinone reductase-like Zn-dependent oxidoreductase
MSTASKSAHAVRFTETGGPEVLHLDAVQVAAPAPHEVRLQVKAIGLNRADALYRSGQYFETPVFPAGLGYEAAGRIEAIGTEVSGLAVGDAVSVIPAFSLNHYGTYGDLVLVPAYAVRKHAASLSFPEAAALWTSFLSTYGMLVERARLQPGEVVLITAASSSTGLAAMQLVNWLDGVSIAVTRRADKADALRQAGATHVIVAAEQDVAAEVQRLTGGKGANVVLDPVGGPQFAHLLAAAADHARVLLYGLLNFEPVAFPFLEVLRKSVRISGYNAEEVAGEPARLAAAIAFINDGLAAGKFKPTIAKTFPLADIVAAHRYLESNQQFGKVVVTV